MNGPLDFVCPHCKALPGYTCVSTFRPDVPYAPGPLGKPVQHLLRWIAASDAERKLGAVPSLDEWMLQTGAAPEPKAQSELTEEELLALF